MSGFIDDRYCDSGRKISGSEFLLAAIVGLEVCPRIGAGLGGKDLLSRGIHSGALMGTQNSHEYDVSSE